MDEVKEPRYHRNGLGKMKIRRNEGLRNLVDYRNRDCDGKKYPEVLSYFNASTHLSQTAGCSAFAPTVAL